MSEVPSPCRNTCALDSARRVCRSCHRTIEEIVAWPRLDEAGKRAVWARLEGIGALHEPDRLARAGGQGDAVAKDQY